MPSTNNQKITRACRKNVIIKDPVHNYIHIRHELINKLLQTKELQRLRHVFQVGVAHIVYPTGTHTRFSHSLGTYEIARQITSENTYFRTRAYEKMLFMCAALLHDIGHGPFSHSFEESLENYNHEKMGVKILKSKKSQVNSVLNSFDENLVGDICDLLMKKSKYKAIQFLVSSDVDVDRMDYVLRDSYYTSKSLGGYDLSRIINTMKLDDQGLYFNIHGVNVLEDFLIGRIHMYSQVYTHKKSIIMHKIITKYLQQKVVSKYLDPKCTLARFDKSRDVEVFNKLTDHHIYELLINEKDPKLVALANAIIYRDQSLIVKSKLDEDLDLELLYDPRQMKSQNIYNGGIMIMINDEKKDLNEVSSIIKVLKNSELEMQGENKYYVKDTIKKRS